MRKKELIKALNVYTFKDLTMLKEICECHLSQGRTAKVEEDCVRIFSEGGCPLFKLTMKEAQWVSRRPKNFDSISNKYLERMYKGGVYNRIVGVNPAMMQMDKPYSYIDEDETYRPSMSLSKANPK